MKSQAKMQDVAKVFSGWESSHTYKVIAIPGELRLDQEHLLFASELGARYVASGPSWREDLRDYIKRVCISAQKVGSVETFEEEIERARRAGNKVEILSGGTVIRGRIQNRDYAGVGGGSIDGSWLFLLESGEGISATTQKSPGGHTF